MTALDVVTERSPIAHSSAVRVEDAWYVVCTSAQLGNRPKPVRLYDTPLVVFRTPGGVAAVLDRCPHRNAPLSRGRVEGGQLVCGYHGWAFDGAGRCRHVPGLCGKQEGAARNVPAYAARIVDGLVWVYAKANAAPISEPFRFPHMDDPAYTVVRTEVDMEGSLHAAAENALDVPHTAYLHGGLFRKPEHNQTINVEITRSHDRVQAEYIGEARPTGVMGKLLAPSGGVVTHYDRFIMPCITQVEYKLGEDSHIVATAALSPLTDYKTRLFGVAAFRIPMKVPGRLLGRLLKPLALYVLHQDAVMLKEMTRTVKAFGDEKQVSTELDVIGPQILKLLKDAQAGKRARPSDKPMVRRVQMRV